MPTNEEIVQRIIAAIKQKTGDREIRCPICNHATWHVPPDFTYLPIEKQFGGGLRIGGPLYPLVPLICGNCGNTHLLNLKVLGVEDLDSLKYEEEKPPESPGAEKPEKADAG